MVLGFLGTGTQAQQQFSYTQYLDNLTPIIPSWSLTRENAEFNFLGRKQWVGIEGAPETYMLSGFVPFKEAGATAGVFVMNDKVAIETLTEANFFLAKGVNLDYGTVLSVSMNAGFRRYRAPYSTLDVADPTLALTDVAENEINVGASVLLFSEQFFAGFSMPRLTLRKLGSGSTADSKLFRNSFYLTAGYNTQLNDFFSLQSAALMAYTFGVPLQGDISVKGYLNNTFGFGLAYRTNNELGLLTSVNVAKMRVGYSYLTGFGARKISGLSQATHEISLTFLFGADGSFTGKGNQKQF